MSACFATIATLSVGLQPQMFENDALFAIWRTTARSVALRFASVNDQLLELPVDLSGVFARFL